MEIKTSENKTEIMHWANECLDNGLFVRGRMAYGWFKLHLQIPRMSVLKKEKEIDGWAFTFLRSFDPIPFLNVYVKTELRKMGYSRKLLEEFVRDYNAGPFEVSNQYKKYYKKMKCLEGKLI